MNKPFTITTRGYIPTEISNRNVAEWCRQDAYANTYSKVQAKNASRTNTARRVRVTIIVEDYV